jgi:FAD/FMN-containing dehydrogenase
MSGEQTHQNGEALSQIKNILGAGGFIDDPEVMQPYLVAWRGGWTGKSPLIAMPNATEQVAAIAAICHKHHIPLVPQGGNTGTVGGCIPSKQGNEIVINLARMNKIRDLDTVGAIVTAEAGVILQNLQDAAAKAGLLFPLSLASQGSAQIGGNISTNAGGVAVLRYGNMRNLVLGVEAVLADGQIISGLKKLPKDNTGYSLSQYFIGAEGTLGIVTAATLRLFPALRQRLVAMIAISTADRALELLADFRGEGAEYLNAFEIISHAALERVVKNIPGARFPGKSDAPFYLLVELGASSDIVPLRDIFESVAGAALESGKALDAVIAETLAQAAQFWSLRENISDALRKEGAVIHFDIALPLAQLSDFLRQTEPQVKAVAPDIVLAPFGHIGDGNLHYNMYFPTPPAVDAFASLKKKIQNIVYGEVQKRQGSISAEHGIGIDRRAEMAYSKSPAEIEMMKKIKRALDPENLMNPSKLFQSSY